MPIEIRCKRCERYIGTIKKGEFDRNSASYCKNCNEIIRRVQMPNVSNGDVQNFFKDIFNNGG